MVLEMVLCRGLKYNEWSCSHWGKLSIKPGFWSQYADTLNLWTHGHEQARIVEVSRSLFLCPSFSTVNQEICFLYCLSFLCLRLVTLKFGRKANFWIVVLFLCRLTEESESARELIVGGWASREGGLGDGAEKWIKGRGKCKVVAILISSIL